MRFDLKVPDGPAAFVFPGQGAHCPEMLDPFRHAPEFTAHYDVICELLGSDPLSQSKTHPQILNRNAESSLLTVLASVLCLGLVREMVPALVPVALAGYSVGQWSALYASGALSVQDLFRVVYTRARYMDACVDASEPSGMLAVMGVQKKEISEVCEAATERGLLLQITNENAPAHITIGGTETGLVFAEAQIARMSPKRLYRVPVAGAWHGELLDDAVPKLAEFLGGIAIGRPGIPVIDNTTGDWLPEKENPEPAVLSRQLASPVLWKQGVETMVKKGTSIFVEIGYGDLLTKYGFFINRSAHHIATAPPPRARS